MYLTHDRIPNPAPFAWPETIPLGDRLAWPQFDFHFQYGGARDFAIPFVST
jgi:hypothetical protein